MNIFLDANICLDLLDSIRPTSKATIKWYMSHKDDMSLHFYFSADFITTFYYILTEKRKINSTKVIEVIEALSFEITPFYLAHSDFLSAKDTFTIKLFDDFEDLMILQSALRCDSAKFITNDKALLEPSHFSGMPILGVL